MAASASAWPKAWPPAATRSSDPSLPVNGKGGPLAEERVVGRASGRQCVGLPSPPRPLRDVVFSRLAGKEVTSRHGFNRRSPTPSWEKIRRIGHDPAHQ